MLANRLFGSTGLAVIAWLSLFVMAWLFIFKVIKIDPINIGLWVFFVFIAIASSALARGKQ